MNLRRLLLLGALLLAYTTAPYARTLTACGHPFYPPVSWEDSNQLKGLGAAVTTLLFNELGHEVRLVANSNWKRCLYEVELGNVDIVVAAYRIPSRTRFLTYAEVPLIADPITLFVNAAKPAPFDRLEDLGGKSVGLLLGDSFGEAFDQYVTANSRIQYVSTGEQNLGKLALGRIDFMPLGRMSGELQLKHLGLDTQIKPLQHNITIEHYYLAVSKKSGLEADLPYLERRLAELSADGTLQRLTDAQSKDYLSAQ